MLGTDLGGQQEVVIMINMASVWVPMRGQFPYAKDRSGWPTRGGDLDQHGKSSGTFERSMPGTDLGGPQEVVIIMSMASAGVPMRVKFPNARDRSGCPTRGGSIINMGGILGTYER